MWVPSEVTTNFGPIRQYRKWRPIRKDKDKEGKTQTQLMNYGSRGKVGEDSHLHGDLEGENSI